MATKNDLLLLSFDTFINQIDPITGDIKLIHNANATGGPISSLEFDVKNNCVFFGIHTPHHISSHKILQTCLDDNQDEKIIADVLSYHTSLAFDWSTDLLQIFKPFPHRIFFLKRNVIMIVQR